MRFILLLTLLSGCGEYVCDADPDFWIGEICVYTNDFDVNADEMEYIMDYTEAYVNDNMGYRLSDMRRAYPNFSITFYDEVPEKPGYSGWTEHTSGPFERVEIALKYKCLGISSLAHEMLHAYRFTVLSPGGKGHPRNWFEQEWIDEENEIGRATSAEYKIEQEIAKYLPCEGAGNGTP